jgi:invasion protein IalB
MRISSLLIGLGFTALLSGAALAQQLDAPAPGAAPLGTPDVKNVGDWAVRCYPTQNASPCDMFQQSNDKNTQQRVLAISIAYIPHLDRHAIQVSVPLGVSLAAGVVVHTASFSSPALPFRRCDRTGCYVEMLIDNSIVTQLSSGGDTAGVKIVSDDGKNYDLKLSLNGFAAAHDSMAEQARAKAKAPDGAAPAAAPAKKK